MKYVWIFAVVVIMVRIDLILKYFDKAAGKLQDDPNEIKSAELKVDRSDLISMVDDQSLKQTPKKKFFALMENFLVVPDRDHREQVLLQLREHLLLFDEKLDPQLESVIFKLRDLLKEKNHEVGFFLLELISLLKGENLAMVQKFMALMIDVDVEEFLFIYSKSKDQNCQIITSFGDTFTDDVKAHTMRERKENFSAFLSREKLDPFIKAYGEKCLTIVSYEVSKLNALEEDTNQSVIVTPTAEPTVEPAPPAPEASAPVVVPTVPPAALPVPIITPTPVTPTP